MSGFFDISVTGIDGTDDLLRGCDGRVVLAVNVASECGFTPQYAGLQALHDELAGRGFSVIGFPCNQFGAQEPGSDADIVAFCTTRYAVSFPLSTKIDVNGERRHPLYAWLTSDDQGHPGDIEWNFEKFLIGRDGRVHARYPSATTPDDAGLLQDIVDAIDA